MLSMRGLILRAGPAVTAFVLGLHPGVAAAQPAPACTPVSLGNSAVLVPVFGDARKDSSALETISEFFHGRKVVPVDCRELVYGFGGIHCVTQQQPAPEV